MSACFSVFRFADAPEHLSELAPLGRDEDFIVVCSSEHPKEVQVLAWRCAAALFADAKHRGETAHSLRRSTLPGLIVYTLDRG